MYVEINHLNVKTTKIVKTIIKVSSQDRISLIFDIVFFLYILIHALFVF